MAKKKSTQPAPAKAKRSLTWSEMRGVLKGIHSAGACYTNDQVSDIEAAIQADTFGFTRRVAMLLLTKPAATLKEDVKKDRGLALAVTQTGLGARKYIKCLEGLLHDMHNAELRALAAVSGRPDRDELLAEAQKEEVTRD